MLLVCSWVVFKVVFPCRWCVNMLWILLNLFFFPLCVSLLQMVSRRRCGNKKVSRWIKKTQRGRKCRHWAGVASLWADNWSESSVGVIIFHSEPLTFHAAASEPALRAGLSVGTEAIGRAAQCTAVKHLPHETEEAYMRETSCTFVDDLHAGLRHFNRLFLCFLLGPAGLSGCSRASWCWFFCFMSFHHRESVSEWQGEPTWPSLCWRYSATSAGNPCDSFPSSSSTWRPGASCFCTPALSGTAAPEPEGAGTRW